MASRNTQTVQQTSKVWKLQQLLSFFAIIAGVCMGLSSSEDDGLMLGVAFLVGFGGLAWFIIARVGAWWCHG